MDWLVQYQNNVTEWDLESRVRQPGLLMGQDYKVPLSSHYHKSVPIMVYLKMLLGRKAQQINYIYDLS